MKIEYKPKPDCCNHYKSKNFTVGYLANHKAGKISKFKVYICDNCGEAHLPYNGIKGLIASIYFWLNDGCIFIPEDDNKEEDFDGNESNS